ncbi:MAG: hypothetical protein K2U26_07910 [Cyclobacteriaceae bacterium]|nr:hypothetical protein [Cyclobacteriaceae bacterium]
MIQKSLFNLTSRGPSSVRRTTEGKPDAEKFSLHRAARIERVCLSPKWHVRWVASRESRNSRPASAKASAGGPLYL